MARIDAIAPLAPQDAVKSIVYAVTEYPSETIRYCDKTARRIVAVWQSRHSSFKAVILTGSSL